MNESMNLGGGAGLGAADLAIADAVLTSIAEEMGEALGRTAYSPNIKERRDFSCGVFDAEGQMVAQAAHMPVHLGAMPTAVRQVMELGPFSPGDVLALNDPFRGGTHLPDLTTVSPVFVDGSVIGFVATRAHHADIGGMAPGSMPVARELLQEGLVIPPIHLVNGGVRNESVFALIVRNSRAPEERRGDLRAQMAATSVGVRRLEAAAVRFGVDGLLARFEALLEHGDRVVRAVISEIPDGRYEFEDRLEVGPEGLAIRLALSIEGDEAHFDFTGTDAETELASLNAVAAVTRSACYYTIRCLAGADAPANEGCYRAIRFTLPERCVVAAGPPRAVSAGNVETSQRITDVALGALAQALPDRIPAASSGTMNNVTIGGYDRARERPYAYYETIAGGAGGGPRRAGRSGVHTHMTNTMNTPIEALPLAYPFTVERYELRVGTGGAGLHPGGCGVVREYLFHDLATVSLVTERRRFAPWGLGGGEPGSVGRNTLIRADGETRDLGARAEVDVGVGDRVRIETPGGGGWGSVGVGRVGWEAEDGEARTEQERMEPGLADQPSEDLLRGERGYHEAGHAIAAYRLGEQVRGLTIEIDGSFDSNRFEAYTHIELDKKKIVADPTGALRKFIVIGLAGSIAESYVGRLIPIHKQAGTHATLAVIYAGYEARIEDGEAEAVFETLLMEAENLITDDAGWNALIEVGNTLADSGSMERKQFLKILDANGIQA